MSIIWQCMIIAFSGEPCMTKVFLAMKLLFIAHLLRIDMQRVAQENFERFISCKSTIDDIHLRLRSAERSDPSGGPSTADMRRALTEVPSCAPHLSSSKPCLLLTWLASWCKCWLEDMCHSMS